MNVPGHFPLSRASTASTIVDGALNRSITRETTSENDSTQSEWENATFGEIRFGDMQRQQSVRALEEFLLINVISTSMKIVHAVVTWWSLLYQENSLLRR
jgi:hypothetical protein